MKKIIAPLAALLVALTISSASVVIFYAGRANAQSVVDAGAVDAGPTLDAGPGSGSGAVALPSDSIHDPVTDPAATYDDMKAAKKLGWGILALAIIIVVCKVLARLGGMFKKLGEGKFALIVASVGTLAMTAYNALLLGGTWLAALAAAIVAGAAAWDAAAKPKPAAPTT